MVQNQLQFIIPESHLLRLALVNAGKFTFGEVFYWGSRDNYGLASAFVSGWDLIFWIFGFGILILLTVVTMYRKYEAWNFM
jgi:hypothetical protein